MGLQEKADINKNSTTYIVILMPVFCFTSLVILEISSVEEETNSKVCA